MGYGNEFANSEASTSELKILSSPRLDPVEKLYVRAYLSSLSHIQAHRVAEPSLKNHSNSNKFSDRENIQFHISLHLQTKAESLDISTDKIMERLWYEATLEGGKTNQTARIQALQILGKQLGMFQDKKEEYRPVFNIIQYGNNKHLDSATSSNTIESIGDIDDKQPINQIHNNNNFVDDYTPEDL
jgi:hypothetical protein